MSPPFRLACAMYLALCATSTFAQQTSTHPVPLNISARDLYTRDGYLSNARIEIRNNATGKTLETVTGADGRVTVHLSPGSYRIAITAAGYGGLVSERFCVVAGVPANFHAALGPDRGPSPRRIIEPPDRSVVHTPGSVQSTAVMSAEEIVAAMTYGRKSTKLTGYRLTGSRLLERWDIGHLFTPFLRVATMTQVADATNKPFTADEIPKQLVEQVVWIVATPGSHFEDAGDETRRRFVVAPQEIVIEPDGKGGANAIRPPWKVYLNTQCDAHVFESILGPQFLRPGIVAAFPMDVLRAGNRIAVTYSTFAERVGGSPGRKIDAVTRRVNIREEDLRNWK